MLFPNYSLLISFQCYYKEPCSRFFLDVFEYTASLCSNKCFIRRVRVYLVANYIAHWSSLNKKKALLIKNNHKNTECKTYLGTGKLPNTPHLSFLVSVFFRRSRLSLPTLGSFNFGSYGALTCLGARDHESGSGVQSQPLAD